MIGCEKLIFNHIYVALSFAALKHPSANVGWVRVFSVNFFAVRNNENVNLL
jgi:hypothetical protein